MINARQLAPLLLLLTLAAAPLRAQPDAGGATDTASAPAAGGSAQQSGAQQPAPAPSEPTSNSAGASSQSPFDYRSSEEISEDVPVSFPVDI